MQKKQPQENLLQESSDTDFKRYRPEMKCEELIQNIHDLCERYGMSYYALAKAADVSPSTLHELMTGKTKPFTRYVMLWIFQFRIFFWKRAGYLVW